LSEDGWAAVFTLDQIVTDEEKRRKDYQTDNRNDKIVNPLDASLYLAHAIEHISVFKLRHSVRFLE
jgi:hypothetical protein